MKVVINNLVTEYRDEGQGKILLFLHGWQDSLSSFDAIIPGLISEYRVIRLDLPGFGKTEPPKQVWNLDSYVNFVSDFVFKLNLKVYAFGGHSFGGRIIIKGISNKKFKSEKIILIGSAGIAKRKTFRNYFFAGIAKIGKVITYVPPLYFFRENLRKRIYRFVGGDYNQAGALKNTFLKIIREDLTKNAQKIHIPALLIWGENDTETLVADGRRFKEMILDSQLVIFENAGHFVHKEKPQEVIDIIEKFL